MTPFFTFLIGSACGSLATFLVLWWAFRHYVKRSLSEIEALKEEHRASWETLINRMNHSGSIPAGSTALGMIKLVSLALKRCILSLQSYMKARVWNTLPVISEISGIVDVELKILETEMEDFLQAQRQTLREFEFKQEKAQQKNDDAR